MPVAASGLPSIFLGEMPKTERKLPPVYLCESGLEGASCRLKWLASTCLAGMVGVCLIGVAIYASLNMGDGSGMVSSLKRASLAALQPMRSATLAKDGQSANGQKEDRIQMTAAGFATRQVIHDTVIERQGSREFITIKPYLRIVAGLATELPPEASDEAPAFNPFKLYSDTTPVGAGGEADDAPQAVSINVVDVPGGILPQSDGVELRPDEVGRLVAEAAENFSYAEAADQTGSIGDGQAQLLQAAYHPEDGLGLAPSPHTTVIHKSADDEVADDDDGFDDLLAGAESKTLTVGRGDTLDDPVRQGRRRSRRGQRDHRRARPDLLGQRPQVGPGASLHHGAGAVRHRADGAGQGVDLRSRQPPRHRGPQPAGRLRGLDRADRQRRQDAARLDPRHAVHRLLSRRRSSSTFRPTPSSSCCASTPTTSTSSRRSRPATRSRCSSTAATTTRWANCSTPR